MNVCELVEVEYKKIMIPSLFPAILWIVSVCEERYGQQKNKRRKKERKKNTDRTQTKLNAPHVKYNVKTLSH